MTKIRIEVEQHENESKTRILVRRGSKTLLSNHHERSCGGCGGTSGARYAPSPGENSLLRRAIHAMQTLEKAADSMEGDDLRRAARNANAKAQEVRHDPDDCQVEDVVAGFRKALRTLGFSVRACRDSVDGYVSYRIGIHGVGRGFGGRT